MLIHDLGLLIWIYFIFFLLQIIALPLVFYFSNKFTYLKDAGWGFARTFSILFLSLLIWNVAFLKIPINTDFGVILIFSFLFLLSFYLSWNFFLSQKKFWKKFWPKFGKIILIEETIFLLSLIFLFVIRSFQPEILGLEKFMDAGFIQAYLKSPILPMQDIWFAGESVNYYSFGHFYNSILVHLWQVDLAYGYNLLLIGLFGLFSLELFSLAFNLRANLLPIEQSFFGEEKYNFKAAVTAGILAIFLVALGANGHTLWYFLKHGSMDNYWYPDATRFIERTIHEFPAYSFVVCDLHAHVLSLPISLFLLFNIFLWLKELLTSKTCHKFLSATMAVLIGILAMTNTWDIMIYGFLLIFIGVILLIKDKAFFFPLFITAAMILLGTAITSFFWFSNFTAISSGLLLARQHTPIWQLVVLWGPHLFWAGLFLLIFKPWQKIKTENSSISILIMATLFLVLILIVFPEIFYFKDIYNTYPRANTMFKLVFQGFMLLGIVLSLFFSFIFFQEKNHNRFFSWRLIDLRQLFTNKKRKLFLLKVKLRRLVFLDTPIIIFLFFSTLVYPYSAYRNYYGGLRKYQGLDGLAWFARKYPEDFILLNYLKNNEKQQVNIVEAVGESYTEYARFSAFSGMPTILGWRVHEWLWRAGWDKPSLRTSEVEQIYLNPNGNSAQSYLEKYQIKYIVIGTKELETYPEIDIVGLLGLGEVVASSNNHYLIRLFD